MAIFTGGLGVDVITPDLVSASVLASPSGARPTDAADALDGAGGNDRLLAGGGDDTLDGGDGDDWLDGGTGADAMAGGAGWDTYLVDDAGDTVVEVGGPDGGFDRVFSAVGFTLGVFVEALYLSGTRDLAGIGNGLDNVIGGNAGANLLRGLGGDDSLRGEGGDDRLEGGAGNDTLNGGSGDDVMIGGDGDDLYIIDSLGDRAIEAAGGGIDTVHAGIDYRLGAGIEDVALMWNGTARDARGNGADNAVTGNDLDNRLFGHGGDDRLDGEGGDDILRGGGDDDRLDGGSGADRMIGGSGDDIYYVDDAGDRAVERSATSRGGEDTVFSTVGWRLGENIENLHLTGPAMLATGNALDNEVSGNRAFNVLRGLDGDDIMRSGRGADIVIGGRGEDLFRYSSVNGSAPGDADRLRAGDGAAAFEGAGYAGGDRIDLSLIDADFTRGGMQDFAFGTARGTGRVWALDMGGNTLIRANVDGDRAAEFELVIEDGSLRASAYEASDFIL